VGNGAGPLVRPRRQPTRRDGIILGQSDAPRDSARAKAGRLKRRPRASFFSSSWRMHRAILGLMHSHVRFPLIFSRPPDGFASPACIFFIKFASSSA
jgi:hypothetical protein